MNDAFIASKRFGLGAAPGELSAMAGDPRGALAEAIAAGRKVPSPGLVVPSIPDYVHAGFAWRDKRKQLLAKDKSTDALKKVRREMGRNPFILAYEDAAAARTAHAISTTEPFLERLVQYWSNHFTISAGKGGVIRGLAGHYEHTAIRPHVLGSFRDMLHAVVKHPMMLGYLDNRKSIGPNSKVGKRKNRGLNENLAREILELHTLGVNGGYTQEDVTNFARILTGWTYYGPKHEAAYTFRYHVRVHEPGTWVVLNHQFPDTGLEQGEAVLDLLAGHPATARYVATRFARHFVSSTPPQSLVAKLEQTFLDTHGDLAELAHALVTADEAWVPDMPKLLPPYDFMVAAYRATGAPFKKPFFRNTLNNLGQPLWAPPSPEGWPDEDDAWKTPSALLERLDVANTIASRSAGSGDVSAWLNEIFADALDDTTLQTLRRAESRQQAIALALMTPQFQRR
jgi:uncharacterized protein (DUF1800 family)